MANTSVQLEVEDWVRREWLPAQFHAQFFRERVRLSSGGLFDFDAVSDDGKIAATISTSSAMTAGGKLGVGKVMKIRSDLYFLLLAECETRLAILTEQSMFDQWHKERSQGRVPESIQFLKADIPADLNVRLVESRKRASREVSPIRKS